MPALRARWPPSAALWIVEDACEALGAVHADGTAGRRARQPRRVRLLPEQAAHDGGGGRAWSARRRRSRSASTPSATRAARPTWAGSTTTGSASTTASTTSPARSGVAQLERLDELLAGARPRGRALLGGARRRRGPRPALPGRGRRPAQLVRLRRAAAARAWTATRRSRRCASAAWTPSPTCRRST